MSEKPTYEELSVQLDVLRSISSLAAADVKTVADHVLISIVRITGSAYGFYGFINEDESVMTIHSWSGEAMKDCSMVDNPSHFPISEAGVWSEAIRRREPLILNDYGAQHPAKKGLPQGHVQLTNLLVVPFITQGRITSVAAVANRAADYGRDDVTQLTAFFNSIQTITYGKRAEEALRESEKKYRTLFENMAQGAFYQRIDGELINANSAALEMFGLTQDQFVGKTSRDPQWRVIHEDGTDFPGEEHPSMVALKTGQAVRDVIAGIYNTNKKDYVWVSINAIPQFMLGDNRPYQVFVTMHDITERKQVEAELREKNKFNKEIIDSAQEGIIIYDCDLRYQVWNPFMERLSGVPASDVLGRHPLEVFPFLRGTGVIERIEQALAGETPSAIDFPFSLPESGRSGWTSDMSSPLRNAEGEIIGVIATVRDITERKQSEGALLESEEKFRSFSEQSLVGIYLIQDGVFKYVNPKFADIFGYTVDACLENMHFRKLVHPDDLALVEKQVQNRVIGKTSFVQYGFRGIKKTGEIIYVEIYGSSILYRGSTAATGTMLDVTDRNRLQAQLEQAQKMESIGTLAGGIAHDFNNILSPIMIHSEMAMMDLPSGSPLQQNMKQIYKAGERAGDLVKQILTFARKQEKERIPLKVSQILKETIKLLRSTLPTTIDIRYNINSEQDTVLSDPTQMNQIIMNLCTNAAHAMEENGGTLEVILVNENIDSESADEFPDMEPGRYVKLTVKDTGQGIEPQNLDKIFEPYFTTKEVGKGTGMGLALVHGIVKSYGGAVTVQSEMGKGTSFHVYLPLFEDDANVPEAAQDSVQLPTGTERILFVDDEKGAVDVMQLMLEKLGYKVTARTSSIEALEAFRNKPQEFDLVITDMTMPNMTGKDLAKELMVIRPDIPIILCTGFSEKIDERRAGEMGISAYVMKPIVMRQIAITIREVLD